MARLKLTIDEQTSDLWSASSRRILLNTAENIQKLEWTYRMAAGGLWDGTAIVKLDPDGAAYEALVEQGLSGVARIWWLRDEANADQVDDETDLLWVGLAEDAKTISNSGSVEFRLRGLGEFLKTVVISQTFTAKKLGEAVQDVLQEVIDASGSPLTSHDVDLGGTSQRRVSVEFDKTPADSALKDLAELAGGPAFVGWGVRPADDSDNFGVGYFKQWTGHLYEKDSTVQDRVFSVDRQHLVKKTLASASSGIRNAIRVIGDEIPQGERVSDREFYEATVEALGSIKQWGRREEVIQDSSLTSDGQCALVAAGTAKSLAGRSLELDLDVVVPLKDQLTESGKRYGLVQSTLRNAGRLITVRDLDRHYIPWGDTQKGYQATRDTGTARYMLIDTSGAPTGSDAPLLDLTGSLGGAERFYICAMKRPTTVAPTIGAACFELDRALLGAWTISGANWALSVYKRNASHNWVLVGSSSTTRTGSELMNEHLVGLRVAFNDAANFDVESYHYDTANGATLMGGPYTIPHSTISSQATTDRLYINAVGSNGPDSFPIPGDSQTVGIPYVVVLNSSGLTPTTVLSDAGVRTFPFKHWHASKLMTNFGQTKAGNGLVRWAFGQSAPAIGFDAIPKNPGAKSEITDLSSPWTDHRSYSWLLGDEAASRRLGTHMEFVPFKAKMEYGGRAQGLSARLTGKVASELATDAIEALATRVQKANENARKD